MTAADTDVRPARRPPAANARGTRRFGLARLLLKLLVRLLRQLDLKVSLVARLFAYARLHHPGWPRVSDPLGAQNSPPQILAPEPSWGAEVTHMRRTDTVQVLRDGRRTARTALRGPGCSTMATSRLTQRRRLEAVKTACRHREDGLPASPNRESTTSISSTPQGPPVWPRPTASSTITASQHPAVASKASRPDHVDAEHDLSIPMRPGASPDRHRSGHPRRHSCAGPRGAAVSFEAGGGDGPPEIACSNDMPCGSAAPASPAGACQGTPPNVGGRARSAAPRRIQSRSCRPWGSGTPVLTASPAFELTIPFTGNENVGAALPATASALLTLPSRIPGRPDLSFQGDFESGNVGLRPALGQGRPARRAPRAAGDGES